MDDRYLFPKQTLDRLRTDYLKHGSLYVAFDFDNTVYDYHKVGDTFTYVESLLRRCYALGFTLILFTSMEKDSDQLRNAVIYCEEHGYPADHLNWSPLSPDCIKPYYNILLDDRAGLREACMLLEMLLKEIENGDIKFSPSGQK